MGWITNSIAETRKMITFLKGMDKRSASIINVRKKHGCLTKEKNKGFKGTIIIIIII